MMATADADGITFSNLLYSVSPFRAGEDESSVDIYDGLDNASLVSVNPVTKLTPTKNSLNLYDEILIEEGTAKEASYNDLQAEHEKCKRQLQEVTNKLQEIQDQNSTLQNENQSLKKNISALIKTARVEINRKDEEISKLQQRLSEFPINQNTYTRTYSPASINHTKNAEGLKTNNNKFRDSLPEIDQKADPRTKQALHKGIPSSYQSWVIQNQKSLSEKRNASSYLSRSDSELLHSDGAPSRPLHLESSSDKGKREGKMNEHQSRESDCRYSTKALQNQGKIADGKLDPRGELQVHLKKLGKNGQWNESKNLELKNNQCIGKRTDKSPLAWEKQPTPKDKLLSVSEHFGDDRSEKLQNLNRKDLKTPNKDESGQKNRQPERHIEQQRTRKGNSPSDRNRIVRSPQKSNDRYVEDRKTRDSHYRSNKGATDHESQGGRLLLALPPPISHREHKRGHPKEDSKKCEKFENMHSKCERHRTEEKRKSERYHVRESRTSQSEKRSSNQMSQKRVKETMKDNAKREERKTCPTEEIAKVVDGLEKKTPIEVRKDEEQSKSKDLKLSFMQKLNLTLSPAKKQTDELKTIATSICECDTEVPNEGKKLVAAQPINTNTVTKQTKTRPLVIHDSSDQAKLENIKLISETKRKAGNGDLAETRIPEPKATSEQQKTVQAEDVKPCREMGEADGISKAPGLESPVNTDAVLENALNDMDTISSVDFDSYSVIDEINGTDSDSLMEVEDDNNGSKEKVLEHPEKENKLPKPVTHKNAGEGREELTRDVPVLDDKAYTQKPGFPDHGIHMEKLCNREFNLLPQARDTNPVSAEDDNSILSIDLNHMRYIPKVISPLKSPIRSLAKVLRMESPYKGPAKSYHLDLISESPFVGPARNLSSERNKENQKPICTDHQSIEMEPQLTMSSDELEEGEIVSDDDKPKTERNSEHSKRSRGKTSPDRPNLTDTQSRNQKAKSPSSSEDTRNFSFGKNNQEKLKAGIMTSSKEVKNKIVSIDCLEKIVAITTEPSTVHECMQMLRAIRKQVRKNYMKFKIQFPVQHFHRIVDSAILNFTSLIKYLDFSKMSKSSDALRVNLCEVIESKLKQIKKNGAVVHLFEQQQSDMKKKLWKLVDEQLEYLFDKIKKILLKMCNLTSIGNECGEGKLDKRTKQSPKCPASHKADKQNSRKPSLNTRTPKPEECALPKSVVGNQLCKRGRHNTNKMDLSNKSSQIRVELLKEKSMQETKSDLKAEKYAMEATQMVEGSHRADCNCGPLTDQQMSGLTFNLVNDAQMGEMFKSLLQGSDLSEKNVDFIDENQWEFKTLEKHVPDSENCGNELAYEATGLIAKEAQLESRVLDDIKWPVASPERDSSFLARLQMPVDPDILDENCMFEIPTSPALKKGEVCLSEKPKSLVSSILLEDLAVSLTIPSPLKSDGHLSFLKPDMFGSVPEDVLSAHVSEDAHLEEEDASEQDIHLALESDNSSSKSSCSSSWASTPAVPGFQYCPSLPMQAVIMEKSNDHFIVKIRRAIPSTSPGVDQVTLTNEPLTSFPERENSEIISEEKLGTLNFQGTPLKKITMSREKRSIMESKMHDDVGKEHVSNALESVKEPPVCLVNDQVPNLSESHPRASEDMVESVEALFNSARQEQDCHVLDPLQDNCHDTSLNRNPDLLETREALCSDPEDPSDLSGHSKERGETGIVDSFKEPSSKTNDIKEPLELLKLPHTDTDAETPCVAVEPCPISSAIVPLVDTISSESHFDICIDMADELPMENEIDSWDLTMKSSLNAGMGSLHEHQEEQKTEDHWAAGGPSERCLDAVRDSTQLLDKSVSVDEIFEIKPVLKIDSPRCLTSLDKESTKRKRKSEETFSMKRPRKESIELTCKKYSKCSTSKEMTLVAKNASSKKAESIRGQEPSPSRSSRPSSSLCAKNIIKKKGEVIISWTRNDDREILLECQRKGPSGKTFAFVATRLKKSSNQVEERFKQLLKLFKLSNCS